MTIFEIMRQYEGQYISIDVYEQRNKKAFPWDMANSNLLVIVREEQK